MVPYKNYRIIILKIGTTSITKGSDKGINYRVINSLAAASAELREKGYKVAIVSSGAMGLGRAKLSKEKIDKFLQESNRDIVSYKQAITSVGQVELMNAYQNIFKHYDAYAGQVLITHTGLDDQEGNETLQHTLEKMFEIDIIPIINANDSVTTKELIYGDNDSLAARVASLIEAERLIILSDVSGFYDKDPNKFKDAKLIKQVKKIDNSILASAGESGSGLGLGGMFSKVQAARLCVENNVPVTILCAGSIAKIPAYISGELRDIEGTEFLVSHS